MASKSINIHVCRKIELKPTQHMHLDPFGGFYNPTEVQNVCEL